MNFLGVTVVFWFQHAPVRGPKTPTNLDSFKRKSTYLSTKTKSPPSGVFSLIWSGPTLANFTFMMVSRLGTIIALAKIKAQKFIHAHHHIQQLQWLQGFQYTFSVWLTCSEPWSHAPEERLHVPEACEGAIVSVLQMGMNQNCWPQINFVKMHPKCPNFQKVKQTTSMAYPHI